MDWLDYDFGTAGDYASTVIIEYTKDGHLTRILPFQTADRTDIAQFATEHRRDGENWTYCELYFWLKDLVEHDGDWNLAHRINDKE